ncbi:hybrid non-ribosomal peptide synthetase/type I polyketide synthase [Aquimarina sp. I32.4]|uniref:hybrid non-ribosomal peptide synthetase/type I polyketide synthase n=1 Tax=Aquimarina sp. I32.4 TaxID=2053903 RepID=UPI000CDE9DD0|nr:hybrid non-ribosomal peptide synthetase/type I polyketide synthase [Aquimarina sp. I32.4]
MEKPTPDKTQILKKALTEIKRLKLEVKKNSTNQQEPIAVIGMACRFPGGINSPKEYWQALLDQKDMTSKVPKDRWANYDQEKIKEHPFLQKGGFLLDDVHAFDHRLFRLSPNEVEKIDPQQRLFLKVCWEAIENSGYAPTSLKGSKTGIYAGASAIDHIQQLTHLQNENTAIDPNDAMGAGFSFISGRASYFFGFQGPGITTDTACSSSLVSVDLACKGLLSGDCNMAIAGGVNLMLSPKTTELMASLNILSKDCQSRTFDATANGTVRGEGSGVVILKKLSDAQKDGDHIHAIIKGSGTNQDGLSSGLTAPYGPAQEKLIRDVWKRSNVDANDIDFIETHGTGTALGDPIEITALGNLITDTREKPVYLGAVKTSLGHLEAAAGIAGLIKAILAVEKGKIPGNLHFKKPSPHINWSDQKFAIPQETIPWSKTTTRKAAISSFGLSGTNAHIVVEQHPTELKQYSSQKKNLQEEKSWPFKFSSVTKKGIKDQLASFLSFIEKKEPTRLSGISYAQNITKADLKEKIVVWADTTEELKINLKNAIKGISDASINRAIFNKKPVFLFSGIGSQYPEMLKEFYSQNNTFKKYLDRCNQHYKEQTQNDLLDIIFSPKDLVIQMRYTQVSIFAIEYALSKMWMDYGVTPNLLIGHSMGEYAAACLAGVFSLSDAIRLITARGELMYALPKNGAMAAVSTNEETIQEVLKSAKLTTIAAINTNEQTVISGCKIEIDEIRKKLKEKRIASALLKVSHAAHSPLMKQMLESFNSILKTIQYNKPTITIISCLTGEKATANIASWQYWSDHILAPVKFYKSIQSIKNIEDSLFLEVGPTPTLINMVEQISDVGVETLASNYKGFSTINQIEKSVVDLYLNGTLINWRAYYADRNLEKEEVPNYTFREQHFSLNTSLETYTLPQTHIWDKIKENIDTSSLTEEEKRHTPAILEFIKNNPHTTPKEEEDIEAPQEIITTAFGNLEEVKTYIRKILIKEWKIEEEDLQNDENLLLLGLNSILIARLTAYWKKDLHISLKPATFLKNSTINQWSELLYNQLQSATIENNSLAPVFETSPEQRYESFSLNEIQYAYWAGRNHEMDWGGVSCSTYFEMDVDHLDIQKFEQALSNLIKRHEMLRCIITEDGTQQIMETIPIPFTVYPISDSTTTNTHLQKLRNEMSTRIIPAGTPMFDIRISELEGHKKRIHFSIDFIIADALSLFIFWKDLYLFYTDHTLPSLEISYKDYLQYHEKRKSTSLYNKAAQYWTDRVSQFPLAPQLPVKDAGQKHVDGNFKRREHWINPTSWKSFVKHAATKNLTPSAALLTLYAEILSAWGGGSHFAIMLTVFNRDDVHPQVNEIIGDFTQLTLVEIKREQQSVAENGTKIQTQVHTDLENSTYSALEFVKTLNTQSDIKDRMYPIVFTSALGVDDLNQNEQLGFLNQVKWSVSSTPQVWIDHQVYNENDGVTLSWDTLDAVFPDSMIDAMFKKYAELVELAIADNTFWEHSLTDVRTHKQQGLQKEANHTTASFKNAVLHKQICTNAIQIPNKTAIVCNREKFSYQQLKKRADQVSQLLQENGIDKGDKVAIQMAKSFDQIAIVVGIVQIGAIYIPFTHDQPSSRTVEILELSGATTIFTDRLLDISNQETSIYTIQDIDAKQGNWKTVSIDPSALAYIIYTSGSTGTPKGVCIQHEAAMNTILDVNKKLTITGKDSVLGVSSLSFDLSVYDIFGILHAGGTLVLPTEEERIDPKCWRALSFEHQVTLWNSVPALMDIYTNYILQNPTVGQDHSIQRIIHSGDWIPLGLIQKINTAIPNAKLTSMGGATEASIWSNYYHVDTLDPNWKSIPYGYPLANQEFYILDEFNRPCPEWVEGKLHIAGKGLATGYLKDKERTDKAFFFEKELQKRLYDTGDYGRYRQGDIIEFLGRKDAQLKINGYRVEIGEIQAAFRKCKGTLDAVIVPIGDKMDQKKLIAFVKYPITEFSETALKSQLKTYLPGYFIPEKIFCLDEYPITSNGKVDRKQLVRYYNEYNTEYASVHSNTISKNHPVLDITRKSLGIALEPHDNFADLGVSSIDIIKLANELETHFTDRPSVGEMIRYESIQELIAYYEDKNFSFDQRVETPVVASQFSLYTNAQINYLNGLAPIEDYEEYVSFKEHIDAQRTDLSTENSVALDLSTEEEIHSDNNYKSFGNYLNTPIDTIDFKQFIALYVQKNISGNKNYTYNSLSETYPIQTYLTVFNNGIKDIGPGNYYLDIKTQSLIKLSDLREEISISFRNMVPNASFLLHFVADIDAVYPIHQNKSLQICYIESGILSQLLETKSPSLDIGCAALTDYDFDEVKEAFDLSINHFYLHTMVGGKIDFANAQKNLQRIPNTALNTDSQKICSSIIETCKTKEIQLYVADGALKFKAPKGAMTKEILEKLKANKPALIQTLIQPKEQEQVTHILRKHQPFRLTPVQLAYLFGRSSNFELGNINTHYYLELECNTLDPERLQKAWNSVIKRHEMLRTKVYEDATQRLMKEVPYFTIPVKQIQSEQELIDIRNKWSHRSYQLGTWPMYHLQLSQIGDHTSRIHFSFDCLLLDASSTEMVVQEIFATYSGREIEKPQFTFKEYLNQESKWLHTHSNLAEAQHFWDTQIDSIPPAPILPLKTNFQDIEKPFFKRWKIILDTDKSKSLLDKIKQHRFTPSAVVCTIFMKILAQWSANDDFTINLTIFNRFPIHKDVPKILGDFTNITLISYFKDDNKSILQEIEMVQEQLWKAVEYRTQDGMDILKRLGKDTPGKALMPIVFTSLLFGDTQEEDTHYPPELKEVFAISQTPQVAMDHQVYERNGSIHINWDIVEGIFEPEWIDEMVVIYENMLCQLIALEDWNDTLEVSLLEKI